MVVNEPGEIRLAYYTLNLVSVAYVGLIALVATKAGFKGCPGCGRAFPPDSSKQKYHDPPQCATRAGQRRCKRSRPQKG
jgi:hypothetical protein